ncbi:MAG: hypothetical protein QW594_01395 [Candidatus Woesearchaeota archaeon]
MANTNRKSTSQPLPEPSGWELLEQIQFSPSFKKQFKKELTDFLFQNEKNKKSTAQEKQKAYDIFLGGPWEQYCQEPYKQILKQALPTFTFYDPEVDSDQRKNRWFKQNYAALSSSNVFFSYEPLFPGAGVCRETGMFYALHQKKNKPLENLLFYFPKEFEPAWGITVAKNMGKVVRSMEEAIAYLKKYFKCKDTRT